MGRTAGYRLCISCIAALIGALLLPALASAHVERASYWPDPAPDCTVSPCAGGAVPAARSLYTALAAHQSGATQVVCQGAVPSAAAVNSWTRRLRTARTRLRAARRRHESRRRIARARAGVVGAQRRLRRAQRSYNAAVLRNPSIARLRGAIADARAHGYSLRPSQARLRLSARAAATLLTFNERLLAHCGYHEIQAAVDASSNNGRVVVMPGLYTEPTSRAKRSFDPACAQYTANNGESGGAVSYPYQFHCPNDQNLIAVIGRGLGSGTDPDPPREDRHGIPNLGPCIRCNLQLGGSGVGPDDVVVDAGRVESGNGPPIGSVKDVGIRVDRADGFVLRNLTVRHAKEHDIYVLESDGYLLDRFKAFWAGEYGVLTFVEDHGLMQNCDAAGSGDSGLYPGAGADTGAERDTHYYPRFRLSQEIRYCDSHHNLAGYSGTDGNATHVDHNEFYDNALGFTTDVFTAPGHPGFPQDSDVIEDNDFYSNNFNPYAPDSGINAAEPGPVGTGFWIAGGNDNVIRFNRFYDNWRRGTMLFAAPDATICGPVIGTPVTACDPTKVSTSYNNSFYGNVMGVAPDGTAMPNGTDFWWDSYPTN